MKRAAAACIAMALLVPLLACANLVLGAAESAGAPRGAGAPGESWEGGPHAWMVQAGGLSVNDALAAAAAGDTIIVDGGVHQGPFIIATPVQLVGRNWPVLDGLGASQVVIIDAPDTTVTGFEIRGSGHRHDRGDAAVAVFQPNATVSGNRIHDALFGVWIERADGVLVEGNDIRGLADETLPRRGDAVRVWYSRDVVVRDNTLRDARDLVLWYAEDTVVSGNRIVDSRYGVHMMYSHGARIVDNQIVRNAVGSYVMYTKNVEFSGNLFEGHRGASGYALAFKEADNVTAAGNLFVDNAVGFYLDHTPFSGSAYARFTDNVLAYNDAGVVLLPSTHNAAFSGNTFWQNAEQVAVHGGVAPGTNHWSGNYWSDYQGFDGDGDGFGDVPYQADRLFEHLVERQPELAVLRHGPVVQALEFAAAAFPVIRPKPTLTDASPMMRPGPLPAPAGAAPTASLMGAAALVALVSMSAVGLTAARVAAPGARFTSAAGRAGEPLLRVRGLRKRYNGTAALEDVSFDADGGSCVALWGANGAGKSTLLKALLGLVACDGEASVGGLDIRRGGKQARRLVGYVPQAACLPEWPVTTVVDHFARLRGARGGADLLDRFGLTPHAGKRVGELSGGLRQRLSLALALLGDPPVLLLDEPTANLDPEARRVHLELLGRLRDEGKLIVFASHRLDEVAALADRLLILEDGRLREADPREVNPTPWTAGAPAATLWLAEANLARAQAVLGEAGVAARRNGRDREGHPSLCVQGGPQARRMALGLLGDRGIPVLDVEVEAWN